MRAAVFLKYVPDTLIIAGLAAAAAAAGIFAHGATKPYTGWIAGISPVVFAVTVFALFAIAAAGQRVPYKGVVQRLLVGLAVAAVIVPSAFLEVESLFAPAELARGTDVPTVVAEIQTNKDLDRLKAWARLRTMQKSDQEAAATALAPLLIGADDAARRSAELTLDVALKRHSVATVVALAPELQAYLTAPNSGPEAARAAAFIKGFVEANAGSIRRALQGENRVQLPAGGTYALMLALAANPGVGRQLLEAYAGGAGDPELVPEAQQALALAKNAAH